MAYRGQEDLHASEVSQVWKRSYLDKWTWTLLSHVLWRVQVKTCVGYWQSPHCVNICDPTFTSCLSHITGESQVWRGEGEKLYPLFKSIKTFSAEKP